MASIQYLQHGGMEGIAVNYDELRAISKELNTDWVDEYVPIPGISLVTQLDRIRDDVHKEVCSLKDSEYWENTDDGRHGWACSYCGRVHQWG